ncbi:MAG: LD-carboxypeptidase [Clostridiales bacterium]|nr:LD-carboxypeptidase [Clostridiales bacterium]
MKYGDFLTKNGTIGFVAPSFGCNIEPYRSAFENAQRRWKRQGYHLDLGPNCYAGEGVGISNTPELCGRELTDYYLSKDNDILISCGGGELMCEILDHVDWDAIAKAPAKWYMGFSDNTNMTYLLATLCDTASIYGPCAASFGMKPQHKSLKDAFALLTGNGCGYETDPAARLEVQMASGADANPVFSVEGYPKWELEGKKDEENPLAGYNLTEKRVLKFYNGAAGENPSGTDADPSDARIRKDPENSILSGKEIPETVFEGRLLGGCMDCLVNLLGTCYDRTGDFLEKYKEDGIIWFLEACDLNVFGIRRAMWQMEHAGWFRYVKGFLIGRPLSGLEPMINLDRYQAVLDVAGRKGVPVVMDVDLGHLPPMMPMITGSYAAVHVNGNEIRVDMELRALVFYNIRTEKEVREIAEGTFLLQSG